MRGVENLVGVFDTEQARIIGVAAKGTTDVSYFAAQDTPTVGVPVTAVTDPVTGGITKIATLTQAQYDALATKAADTLYIIVAG